MDKLRVGIHGAAGRMGCRLIALGSLDPELTIAAALESSDHEDLGKDAGEVVGIGKLGVNLTANLHTDVDVVIDFSSPEGADAISGVCLERAIPLVMATTGLDQRQRDHIAKAAEAIPIVWAPNMSLAVNLAMKLAATAADILHRNAVEADVEVIERHHRYKEDAPSGTALRFGEIIAGVMGQTSHAHGRSGRTGKRPRHEIGYHALRVGDNPGEHTIVFGLMGESFELTVRAMNRDSYAIGALAAAKFLVKQRPGLYSMVDVLGL